MESQSLILMTSLEEEELIYHICQNISGSFHVEVYYGNNGQIDLAARNE